MTLSSSLKLDVLKAMSICVGRGGSMLEIGFPCPIFPVMHKTHVMLNLATGRGGC